MELTPEQKAAHDTLLQKLKDEVTTQVKALVNGNDLATIKEKMAAFEAKLAESNISDAIKTEVIDLATRVKALTEKSASEKRARIQSIAEQLKTQIAAYGEKWTEFSKGQIKGLDFNLQFKAAGPMTVAGNTNGSAYIPEVELTPGYIDLVRNQPFIEGYSNSSSTSKSRIVWIEKFNPQGQALFIGEGILKPLIDFDWKTNSSVVKKVADKIKVSTEMLDDIDFMAAAIENELKYQVDIATDNALLSGNGTGDNLKGITTYAGGYVLTAVKTTTPTTSDAILAAKTQVETLNFQADYAFINPVDSANMQLAKGLEGVYLIPPFMTADGLKVGGVVVIATNQIPAGHILVGDMTKFIVRNYKPFQINYGWVNDDFEKNFVTIIGERRLTDYIPDNFTGAFVYDTIANIKTAITAP